MSHRMHVKRVHTQIEGCQVHALKNLFEGLTAAALYVNDLLRVFLHGSLDESQQVFLVHAGGRVYMCVHLETGRNKDILYLVVKECFSYCFVHVSCESNHGVNFLCRAFLML